MKFLLTWNSGEISECASSLVFCVGFLISPREFPGRKELLCIFLALRYYIICLKFNYLVSVKICVTPNFKTFQFMECC